MTETKSVQETDGRPTMILNAEHTRPDRVQSNDIPSQTVVFVVGTARATRIVGTADTRGTDEIIRPCEYVVVPDR